MYLFFDTETTGLPRNWKAPVTDLGNWPRLVQIAWLLYDKDGNKIVANNFIIKPSSFTIPSEASKVHGISTDRALQEGVELAGVLVEFSRLVAQSNYLVAHNMSFDEKIVGAEFLRSNMTNPIATKSKICTMEQSINFCKLRGQFGYKWPKLSELHYKLFGTGFDEAHNAAVDINATAKCFWRLKELGIISVTKTRSAINIPIQVEEIFDEKVISATSQEYINLVAEKENEFLATTPTFYKQIDRTNLPPLKFDISIQNFPSFFSSERKRVFTKTIEVALDKFKSLEIASIDELPYRKFLPVLREDKKLTFIGEIIEHVIKQNEFVKEIRLNNFLSGILIYDAKVEKVLQGKYSTIFSIPENKNKKSIYNSKELISFFDLSFTEHKLQKWSDVDKRKTLFRRRIGFTQQPLERLTQGHEVKIWVDYHDLTQNKYYVFIEGLSVVEIKDKETYKQYYLYSPTTIKKLEDIYRLLAERHPTYRNIGIGWLFYDEVIDFQKNSKNYKEFEAKLFRRVRVDLKPGGVMVERVEKKGEKDYSWWGMNKYSALQFSENYVTTFDPELEELAAKYDAMDGNEQHYLDDLRADFYSDML